MSVDGGVVRDGAVVIEVVVVDRRNDDKVYQKLRRLN
jgi:hypothetical protein